MSGDFTWLHAMHKKASKFGDGLKPELVELLAAYHGTRDNVAHLPTRLVSAGPAHQFATPEELSTHGIAVLERQESRQDLPPDFKRADDV